MGETSVMLAMLLAAGAPLWGQIATTEPSAASTPVAVHPRVEAIVSMRDKPVVSPAATPAHKQNYEFTLKDSDWLDTGVVLAAGEQANFTASGKFTLSDGRAVGPDGLDRGWMDLLRQFPLNQAKVGAIVGRVSDMGASVPREAAVAVAEMVTPETFGDVPRRVSDRASDDGNEGDMVNFALVGTRGQVEAAYKAAGWVKVDKSVEDAIVNGVLRTLNHEAYVEMPMSTLYLFGRPQDLSFARADPLLVAAERHHLRIWQTDKTLNGKPLWVGSATHDIGFEKDQRNGKVTHKIDPEIDKERDFLLQSFDAAGVFSSAAYVTPADPMLKAVTATGGSFFSDGRIVVMALK